MDKDLQKMLVLLILAIAEVSQTSFLALVTHVAAYLGIEVRSVLTQFYRLLRNPRIDDQQFTAQLPWPVGTGREWLLLTLNWTE